MDEWKRQAIVIAGLCWLSAGGIIYVGVVKRDSLYFFFAMMAVVIGTFIWKQRR